jgi:hypothetical protein
MTDPTRLLTAMRNELELAGLVRRPNTAASVLPPMHVEPSGGAPAPGERKAPETDGNLVATIRLGGDLSEGPFNSYRRRTVIDVFYRSTGTDGLKAGRALDAGIRARLVERADYAQGYTLDAGGPASTLILSASVFGGIGPLSDLNGVRTDLAKYVLEVLAT